MKNAFKLLKNVVNHLISNYLFLTKDGTNEDNLHDSKIQYWMRMKIIAFMVALKLFEQLETIFLHSLTLIVLYIS